MKKLINILAVLLAAKAAYAQSVSPPLRITTGGNVPALTLVTPNAIAPIILCHDGTNSVFSISAGGQIAFAATNNFFVFPSTNTAPASTNAVRWISVQIVGDTNQYKLPLCK